MPEITGDHSDRQHASTLSQGPVAVRRYRRLGPSTCPLHEFQRRPLLSLGPGAIHGDHQPGSAVSVVPAAGTTTVRLLSATGVLRTSKAFHTRRACGTGVGQVPHGWPRRPYPRWGPHHVRLRERREAGLAAPSVAASGYTYSVRCFPNARWDLMHRRRRPRHRIVLGHGGCRWAVLSYWGTNSSRQVPHCGSRAYRAAAMGGRISEGFLAMTGRRPPAPALDPDLADDLPRDGSLATPSGGATASTWSGRRMAPHVGALPWPRASRSVWPRTIEPFARPARMAPSRLAICLPARPDHWSTVRLIAHLHADAVIRYGRRGGAPRSLSRGKDRSNEPMGSTPDLPVAETPTRKLSAVVRGASSVGPMAGTGAAGTSASLESGGHSEFAAAWDQAHTATPPGWHGY